MFLEKFNKIVVNFGKSGLHEAVLDFVDLVADDHWGEVSVGEEVVILFVDHFDDPLDFLGGEGGGV